MAAAIVAVVATSRLDGSAPGPGPVSTPVDEPSVSAVSVAGLDGWEDLAGTWTARNVSFASMTAHLESLGVPGAADELRMALPRAFAEGVDLSLEFHLGRAVLRYDGHELDTQNYSVEDGATLYLRPLVAPGGRSRFAARIEGERLWLEFLDTTVPSHGGISEKVLLTALNTSAPFERVVP